MQENYRNAGRLQVINVVLFSIFNFWTTVFVLPQNVLKEADKRCRQYLWGGGYEEKRKINLVAGKLYVSLKANEVSILRRAEHEILLLLVSYCGC